MLVIVPSRFELEQLREELQGRSRRPPGEADVGEALRLVACGVGLAAAGARAAVLLERSAQSAVVLAGLAGTLDERRLGVGAVLVAEHVECEGIGIGAGDAASSPADADGPLATDPEVAPARVPLFAPSIEGATRGGLLSVASAAADPEQAAGHARRHPSCLAEDMESYAVGLAALETGRSLAVVRGVSNVAGDRRHSGWRVREALSAVARLLARWPAEAS